MQSQLLEEAETDTCHEPPSHEEVIALQKQEEKEMKMISADEEEVPSGETACHKECGS